MRLGNRSQPPPCGKGNSRNPVGRGLTLTFILGGSVDPGSGSNVQSDDGWNRVLGVLATGPTRRLLSGGSGYRMGRGYTSTITPSKNYYEL